MDAAEDDDFEDDFDRLEDELARANAYCELLSRYPKGTTLGEALELEAAGVAR